VVIFTDSEYAIETYRTDVMASTLKECRRCSVLQVIDEPIVGTQGPHVLHPARAPRPGRHHPE
jgi:hypothetical protein